MRGRGSASTEAAVPANWQRGAIPLLGLMKVRRSPRLDQRSREGGPMIDWFEVYADGLRECAADVLRGDFAVEPEVRRRVAEYHRQRAEWWDNLTMQGVEAKAADALRRKDYRAVVAALEPHEP